MNTETINREKTSALQTRGKDFQKSLNIERGLKINKKAHIKYVRKILTDISRK